MQRTTDEAKDIIDRFYGREPEYAYFMGCSTGGREAMLAAQRLPRQLGESLEIRAAVAGRLEHPFARRLVLMRGRGDREILALHHGVDEGEGLGQLSGHINDLAGGMARLSQGLREKSADELMRDVNRIARDNPAMFIAGGVALGFTLTRLLRASSQAAGAGPDHGGDTGRTP